MASDVYYDDRFIYRRDPKSNTWSVYRTEDNWEVATGLSSFAAATKAAEAYLAGLPF